MLKIPTILIVLFCVLHFSIFAKSEDFLISGFNVRQYGQSKMQKTWVVEQIVKIFRRYDLVLMQEIQDSSETAAPFLLGELNNGLDDDEQYELEISQRVGRSNNKEQYGYFYKKSKFEVLGGYQYDDQNDYFEREPYSVHFKVIGSDYKFFMIGLHDRPDDAPNEIDHLIKDVYTYYLQHDETKDTVKDNVIIIGDLNMDCSYCSTTEQNTVYSLLSQYNLVSLVDEDSTVKESTECSYDRVFVSDGIGTISSKISNAQIFDIETFIGASEDDTYTVSDHKPIEMILTVDIGGENITPSNSTSLSAGEVVLSSLFIFGAIILLLIFIGFIIAFSFISSLNILPSGKKKDDGFKVLNNRLDAPLNANKTDFDPPQPPSKPKKRPPPPKKPRNVLYKKEFINRK